MKIGIISECQRQDGGAKRRFFRKRPLCTEEIIDEERNGFCIVAVQLPYTIEQLQDLSEKKRRAALCRACDILLSRGARGAVYTAGLKEIFTPSEAVGVRILQRGDLFYRLLPELVRKLIYKCDLNSLSARLGVSSAGLGRVARNLICELCYDVRYVRLFTSDTEQGEKLSQSLSDELGLPITVAGRDSIHRCDILIDLDNNRVKIGRDLTVDGLELDIDTGCYDVDTMEIASGLNMPVSAEKIRYCLCGKNKLTL